MVPPEPAVHAAGPADRSGRGALYATWAAAAVSGTGRMLSAVAVPWAVLHTTGSAGSTGAVVTFSSAGMAVVSFLSGPLLDRVGRGRAAVGGLLIAAVAMGMIPALYISGSLKLWHVLLLVFVASSCDSAAEVAVRTLVPEAAERGKVPLESANSVFSAIDRLSLLIGPVIAGGAIALFGARNVLWADTVACAVAALVLAVAVKSLGIRGGSGTGQGSYLSELASGVKVLSVDPVLRTTGVTAAAANALAGSLYTVVLIAYAGQVSGGAGHYAAMMASLGGGALVGAVAFGFLGPQLPRRACYLLGYAGCGVSTIALAAEPGTAATLGILAVGGLCLAPIGPLMASVYQERIAEAERGRVFSAQNAINLGAIALGVSAASAALGAFGLRSAIVVIGGLELAIALVSTQLPSLRMLEDSRAKPGAAVSAEAVSTGAEPGPDPLDTAVPQAVPVPAEEVR